MDQKKYKLFVTLSWLSGIVYVLVSFMSEPSYPEPLKLYIEDIERKPWGISDTLILAFGIPLMISMIVSYVGLYHFKNYARKLFLITHIVAYIPIDFNPTIESYGSSSLLTITYILTGIVLGASFFDREIVTKFKAEPIGAGQPM